MGVPQLIASANRRAGVLTTGSPLRYFGPVASAAIGGTAVVLTMAWQRGADRRAAVAATATLSAAMGLSAYLIRTINIPLLNGEVEVEMRPRLISRWHKGNAVAFACWRQPRSSCEGSKHPSRTDPYGCDGTSQVR